MKKLTKFLTTNILISSLLLGCSAKEVDEIKKGEESLSKENASNIKVTTTIYPVYDWAVNILGSDDNVEMLLDKKVDIHSYEPTAEDILQIQNSDVFIYVGGHSDDWVEDVIDTVENEDLVTINLMELLGDKIKPEMAVNNSEEEHNHDHDHEHEDESEEEHSHDDEHEGEEAHSHDDEHESEEAHSHDDEHESEEGHNHDHDHESEEEHNHNRGDDHESEEEHSHDHEHQAHNHDDEHIWLSLKNAHTLVDEIATILSDTYNEEDYLQNADTYTAKLDELDKEYEKAIKDSSKKTLLFGDRFPFRYLASDYDLDCYAAFSGCSAETEASFETIVFLSDKVDELDLDVVLELESANHEISKTVIENTDEKDQEVMTLNSLEYITEDKEGMSYLSAMKDNLEVIKSALK